MSEFTYRLALRIFRGVPVKKNHPVFHSLSSVGIFPLFLAFHSLTFVEAPLFFVFYSLNFLELLCPLSFILFHLLVYFLRSFYSILKYLLKLLCSLSFILSHFWSSFVFHSLTLVGAFPGAVIGAPEMYFVWKVSSGTI